MKPYTPREMKTGTVGDRRGVRFEALYAEAKEALSHTANQLRSLTAQSREANAEATADWQRIEAGIRLAREADDGEQRNELARAADVRAAEIAQQKAELARLEAVVKNLESSWLFLERGPAGRLDDPTDPSTKPSTQFQIVEAQEAERSRLAQEVHDGPAQALANAVFQIEYIDKIMAQDAAAAHQELRSMGESLRRELTDMRAFIHQLQNPLIGALGLNGALKDSAENVARSAGLALELDLRAPEDVLDEAQQTVALRVVQEALRNVRKHAHAKRISLSTALDPGGGNGETDKASWVAQVHDDGSGFDPEAAAVRSGQRNFGLRFMRERADLIGATLSIESRAREGTTVRLTINGVERR